MDPCIIERLTALDPSRIDGLRSASRSEGFRFLERLCEEWENGSNRFDQYGEGLFTVSVNGELVAIGGINRQDDFTCRLRRFYVLPSRRRRGLGTHLLHHILTHAAGHFRRVVLRTETETADRFYVAYGFTRIQDPGNETYQIELEELNVTFPATAIRTPRK